MRWVTIAVALTALVLVSAGCGGDDEAASDTTTLTDTTTDETTTDETTTDDTTMDSDDLGSLASGECAELIEAGTKLSEAFGAAGSADSDFDDVSTFFDEFADSAPEEIRADFQILADAWDEYAEIVPELQVEPGETPDPEALAKLQQALASIDQQEVAAASQRISAWAEANCPSG
jgi:ABC-type glycerol-3-phosphate transport system substrate-binding protein